MIAPLASLREVTFKRGDAQRFVVGHWESRTVFVPVVGALVVIAPGTEVVCDLPVLDDVRTAA